MEPYVESPQLETLPEGAVQKQQLSPREMAVRDLFVDEYFKDFNSQRACIRVGYAEPDVKTFAAKFQYCPYVQNKIAERKNQNMVVDSNNELDIDLMRVKLINGLMEDALFNGPGASHSARVKAKSELAKLLALEPPKRIEQTIGGSLATGDHIDFASMTSEERDLLHQLLKSRSDAQ